MLIDDLKREQETERDPETGKRLKAAVELLGLKVAVDQGSRVFVEDRYWTTGGLYQLEIVKIGQLYHWSVGYLRNGKRVGGGVVTIIELGNRTELRDSLIKACDLAKEQARSNEPL